MPQSTPCFRQDTSREGVTVYITKHYLPKLRWIQKKYNANNGKMETTIAGFQRDDILDMQLHVCVQENQLRFPGLSTPHAETNGAEHDTLQT